MRVIEIVAAHLRDGGFDGLVCGAAECGCELADLAPCCDNINECEPAYRHADDTYEPGSWLMSTKKPEAKK